ncbi:hypothetical protein Ade02nite_47140 [Paractinoplanes deccanensis]|uniref:Uncharacterized protein n=1 Tax=Paractinoplanes deccanensis TaxID=113561 RepID=A0ABQ3Y7V0_9ACTN|nr:hypothetical protein [Actinoplanes deccanensis]GID76073.1 hypothetical protein Ade02nite_47140 [Actinoplanes deccanensis]
MIEWLVIAGVALLAGAAVSLTQDVQKSVAAWLRSHGLARSALMDAWVVLANTASGIRGRLRLTTRQYGTQVVVLERTYRLDQIDDPQVRALLRAGSHAEMNVLDQSI